MPDYLPYLIGALALIFGALLGILIAYWALKAKADKAGTSAKAILEKAHADAKSLTDNAQKSADELKKTSQADADMRVRTAKADAETVLAKAEMAAEKAKLSAKAEGDAYAAQKRSELSALEAKLDIREDTIDKRDQTLSAKEDALTKLQAGIDGQKAALSQKEAELADKASRLDGELSRVAGLSQDDAKKELMAKVEEKSATEIAKFLAEKRDEAEDTAEANARDILCSAIERYSQDIAVERTVKTVALPNDDMKGRIIGREGRNIKSLESILGVDILIDDTPEVMTVSCFDPIRREIAVRTLEALIKDGRIQPGRIEEVHDKVKAEIDEDIRKTGEETVMKLGLPRINRELCKYIGRLKYRTSFGQNALDHCIQVGILCGMMAAELGLDQTMAKRCGLLHDIGKAADFEMEGSHVEVGVRLVKKYGEPDQVVSAVASHHGDCEKRYLTDELVVAADTLSAARPGARSETLENYIKRVEDIEKICKSYEGVQNCYALQSGRDVRVMVLPDKVDDAACVTLAQKIRDRIQNEMTYPGNIKITIIRETRAIEIAK